MRLGKKRKQKEEAKYESGEMGTKRKGKSIGFHNAAILTKISTFGSLYPLPVGVRRACRDVVILSFAR